LYLWKLVPLDRSCASAPILHEKCKDVH
jgi:hypothetical protein